MAARYAGALATVSALGAQAFLLPPNVKADSDALHPFSLGQKPKSEEWQAIPLPCSECVLSSPDVTESKEGDMPMFIQGGANDLLLNITTVNGRKAIGFEGSQIIYPAEEAGWRVAHPRIHIAPANDHGLRTPAQVSDASMAIMEQDMPTGSSPGLDMIEIYYQVEGVDRHPVTVDPIKIVAVKDENGELTIITVEPAASVIPPEWTIDGEMESLPFDLGMEPHHDGSPPPHHPPPPPHRRPHHPPPPPPPPPAPCHWPSFICRVRDFFHDKMSGHHRHGPCPGRKGHRKGRHHHKGHKDHKDHKDHEHKQHHHAHKDHEHKHGKEDQPEGPGGMRHHHVDDDPKDLFEAFGFASPDRHRPHPPHPPVRPHHPHRHHRGSEMHRLVRGALMFLTPVFLGIAMGMAAGILGMIVGRLIVFIWTRVVRGGQRGYASVQLSEEAAEKAEIQEVPPPDYENEDVVPVYDEKAPIVEETEKKDSE